MRRINRTASHAFLAAAVCTLAALGACRRQVTEPVQTSATVNRSLTVGADTRMLVFAPHPDDEVLAAGGLIQQVREGGGTVHVVYLTSGDSYTDSVRLE